MRSPLCNQCGKPLLLLTDPWPDPIERATGVDDLNRHEWAGQFCLECGRILCSGCIDSPDYGNCPADGSLMLPARYRTMKDYSVRYEDFVDTGLKWLMDP